MRLEEITKRMSDIKVEIEREDADLDALDTELDALKEERKGILDKAEKRKAMIAAVTDMTDAPVVQKFEDDKESRSMEININIYETKEYRFAWLKSLVGKEMDEAEKRAFTSAAGSAGHAIPTETQNEILKKVTTYAPLLSEIRLLNVKGNVKFAIEGTLAAAATHTENGTITAATDTLVSVALAGYEIVKLVQVSDTVGTMSIPAFEAWLTDMLAESIANKISALIIDGAGTTEATGIETIVWDATNSVTVALASNTTAANVQTLVGLLPGGYDAGAKFLMSKKTLFTQIMPLQDVSKNRIVVEANGKYYIYGYEVMIDDRITLGEAILGNFRRGYIGNLPESVDVKTQFDINTNSNKYLGVAMFDGKPALADAFVKLVKATA